MALHRMICPILSRHLQMVVGTRNIANFAGTKKFCFKMKEDKWNKFFCEVAIAL